MMMGFGGYPTYNGIQAGYGMNSALVPGALGYGNGMMPHPDPVVALTNGSGIQGDATPATPGGHPPVGNPQPPSTTKKVATGAKKAMDTSVHKTKQQLSQFFSPNEKGQPWYKDKQKLTISGLGIATVALLGLGLSGGGIARREARTPTEWFHNVFHGRAFKDQQQWLMDEMGRGFKGFSGAKRKRNLNKRMQTNGSTLYLENLIKRLNDHHANAGARYINGFGPKEQALKEASDVWLLHKEILKKPNAYKDFGFESLSEAVQQTHAVMNIHLHSMKREVNGVLGGLNHGADAKEKRALIDGYETLSEKFLDDYLELHSKDSTKYPVGQGAVELGKQVYLRNTSPLLKQGREKEALKKMRSFIQLASGQRLATGAGAESPKRLFTQTEWRAFIGQYAQLFNEYKPPLIGTPKRHTTISSLVHQFRQHSNDVLKGKPQAEAYLKATILELNRAASQTHNSHEIVNELKDVTGNSTGSTFKMLYALLNKFKPEPPMLHNMG